MVSIPEDQLTEQQKQALKLQQADTVIEKAHGWVGIGKEMGQAFDQALASLSDRSNQFAGTKVGKFTMFLVAWKVMGEQAGQVLNALVHILCGLLELVLIVPIFLWSYRRTCMDHMICTGKEGFWLWGKKTYQLVEAGARKDDVPAIQIAHWIAAIIFTIIILVTFFTY